MNKPLHVCSVERTRLVLPKGNEKHIKWSGIESQSLVLNFEAVKI